MKIKRRTLLIILSLLLVALSLASVFFFRKWLLVRPFQTFTPTEIVSACRDQDENLYILDKSGERLLKISSDGELLWQVNSVDARFENASRICVDEEGHVYVQDKIIESGIRLKREVILQYSPDGKYERTVFKRDALEGQIRPSIVSLNASGDDAVITIARNDGVSVREVLSCRSDFFPLKDADSLVLNAVWDKQSGTLWYCTFHGRIFRHVDGINDVLLYDNSEHVEEFESVPRAISYLDGTLYAADRGLRCAIAIDNSSGEAAFLEEELPWTEREVYDNVNADYSPVFTTADSVKIPENGTLTDLPQIRLSNRLNLVAVLVWFSLVVLGLSLGSDVILFLNFLLRKASHMVHIVMAILTGVSILSAMLIGTLFPQFRQQLIDTKFDKAEFCASLTLERLDPDAFLNLDASSDFQEEDYLAVQEAVNSVFKSGSESAEDLYCTMYRVLGDHDTISIVYSMDENSMLLPYDWEYDGSDEQAILSSGKGQRYINRSVEGSYLFIVDPILDEEGTPLGLIEVGTDLDSFERELQDIFNSLLLNLIAVTAMAVMILIEIIYFVRGRRQYHAAVSSDDGSPAIPASLLRMFVFLIFFFTNLTTAVLPVHVLKLASSVKLPGVSSEFLAAVPFSAEVIAGALFSVLGSGVIRRLSLKRSALLCAVLFSSGLALRVLPSYWMVTLGSLVIGIGWGVILLIVNVLIAGMPGAEKDTGFSYYNAAALNGVNSGTVMGGFLLNWVSRTALFSLTAAASLVLLLLTGKYLIHARYTEVGSDDETEQNSSLTFAQFLLSPNILTFFAMLVVPVLTGSYFLIYLYPIIGSRWGLSETYVGYSYLLNGLCVMALSTVMTNLFTRARRKRLGLTLSALLYAAAFSLVAFFRSVPALLAALIILGFSDSFGLPLQTSFYTDQKEVERFGFDKSMGVYSLFENTSQSLGPFVFSYVLVIGVSKGLYLVSIVVAVLAVAFLLLGLMKRRHLAKP